MTLKPCWADVLDAKSVEFECRDHRPVVGRIGSIRRHAVHVCRESLRLTVSVQLSKIGVKGTIFLQHEDDVIHCRSAASASKKTAAADQQQQSACNKKKDGTFRFHRSRDSPVELPK